MSFKVKAPNRLITLISNEVRNTQGEVIQEHGMIMRTPRSYAAEQVASGAWSPTTKGKLKSFLGREARLHKNEKFMKRQLIDLNKEKIFSGKKGRVTASVRAINNKNVQYHELRVVRFTK